MERFPHENAARNTPTGFSSQREAAIAAQVKNMREAGEALKKYIQDDITEMTAEVEKLEADLFRIEEMKTNNQIMSHDLNQIRKKLLSFRELAKASSPEELINLIGAVVERIYIVTENDKQICHIFVKGCTTEDYSDLFGAAEYIEKSTISPISSDMCDSDQCSICTEVQKASIL